MLQTARNVDQNPQWPRSGRQILAQFDDAGIIVYQAYRSSIAAYVVEHGHFAGEFGYARMSWIKPSFLWMMYRSGWGTKPGQEVTLAIRIRRSFFDELLSQAILSAFVEGQYATREDWRKAVHASSVRLQWDPDRSPSGGPLPRRAPQLGLRGQTLEDYGKRQILGVQDISAFVAEQREYTGKEHLHELLMPVEHIYMPADTSLRDRLGLGEAK